MTAIANPTTPSTPISFEALYAKMLPHFRYYARRFSRSKCLDREDVIQDLTGIALEMYTSLVRRGKEVYYSPLVQYAIKRYKDGRRFTGLNSTDVHFEHTQMLGRSEVCHLSEIRGTLDEMDFMEDRTVNVADAVQFNMDYAVWYQQHSERDQQIITDLSMGETTNDVAKKYKVSAGLISQYRKRYRNSWDNFIGGTHKPA